MNRREVVVAFITKDLKREFEQLCDGTPEEHRLFHFLTKAMDILKQAPLRGTKIPRHLWPRLYLQQYCITNLWKYDLPHGWRVVYTLEIDEHRLFVIFLEWFDHKGYEKRFGY